MKYRLSDLVTNDKRSVAARKNIVAMAVIKGLSVLVSFLLVPLTIDYVDSSTYGLWLTISSVVAWIGFFDIGLNNGLRNRFAESKAKGDDELTRKYVSTTYAMLSLIFIPLMLIFFCVNPFIDWASAFKVDQSLASTISATMLITVSYFCLKFILSTSSIILMADQKPAFSSVISLSEQLMSLLVIFLMTKITSGSLIKLSIGLCGSSLLIYVLSNVIIFLDGYKPYAPDFRYVQFSLLPDLFSLGIKFFIIQIAMLLQYQISNIIIMRHFGGDEVTLYNVTYKYFSLITTAMSIIVTPLWSSVTDAYARNDIEWIRRSVKQYRLVLYLLIICGVLMLAVSQYVFRIWLGDGKVATSFLFSLAMMIYVFSLTIGRIEGSVLNGIGAIKIQMYSAIISPIVFIGLTYLGLHFGMKLYALLFAGIFANYYGCIIAPIQYKKIIIENKKGIWIK